MNKEQNSEKKQNNKNGDCTGRQGIGMKPNSPRRDQIIKQKHFAEGGWDEVGFSLVHYGGYSRRHTSV